MHKTDKDTELLPRSGAELAPILLEMRKSSRAASVSVGGVIGVTELSASEIALSSHLGRIVMRGEGLRLTVYANRTAEVSGRITEVELGYART